METNKVFELLNYYYNYGRNGKGTIIFFSDGTHLGYAMSGQLNMSLMMTRFLRT